MNTVNRFAFTPMPGFSTDQTALSVDRFLAVRPALMSPPETSTQPRQSAAASASLEILYPSLYAEQFTPVQRLGDYLRGIATAVINPFAARRPIS